MRYKYYFNTILILVLFCFNILNASLVDIPDNNARLPNVRDNINNAVINSIAIDKNDKIVAGGFFYNGANLDFVLARYDNTTNPGTLDTTFNPNGAQPGVVVTDILPQTGLARGNSVINHIAIDKNNNIITVGYISDSINSRFVVARYTEDGQLDPTLNPSGQISGLPGVVITNIQGVDDVATSVALDQSDEKNIKIIAAGFSTLGIDTAVAVARYNQDGSLDATFNDNGSSSSTPGIALMRVSNLAANNLIRSINPSTPGVFNFPNALIPSGAAVPGGPLVNAPGSSSVNLVGLNNTSNSVVFNPITSPNFGNLTPSTLLGLSNIADPTVVTPTGLSIRQTVNNSITNLFGGNLASLVSPISPLVFNFPGLFSPFSLVANRLFPPNVSRSTLFELGLNSIINSRPINSAVSAFNISTLGLPNTLVGLNSATEPITPTPVDLAIRQSRFNNPTDLTTVNLTGLLTARNFEPFNAINSSITGVAVTNINSINNFNNINNFANNAIPDISAPISTLLTVAPTLNPFNLPLVLEPNNFFNLTDTLISIPNIVTSLVPGIVLTSVSSSAFANLSGLVDVANSVTLDSKNRIIVTGFANNSTVTGILVIRYNSNGTLDTSFNPTGIGTGIPGTVITNVSIADIAFEIKTQIINNEEKILVAGSSLNSNGNLTDIVLVRYNDDGTLDSSFNTDAKIPPLTPGIVLTSIPGHSSVVTDFAFDTTDQNNIKIVVTGFVTNTLSHSEINEFEPTQSSFLTLRYNSNGTLDDSFSQNITPGFVVTNIINGSKIRGFENDARANSVAFDTQNRIITAGFASNGFTNDFALARYTSSGILDTTFNPTSIQPGVTTTNITASINLFPAVFQGATVNQHINHLPHVRIGSEIASKISSYLTGFRPPKIIAPANHMFTNVSTFELTGAVQPEAVVHITVNNNSVMSVKADYQGLWIAHLPKLPDGTYVIVANSTDPISNLSFSSNRVYVTIKTTKPKVPVILSPRDKAEVSGPDILITGTAEHNSRVILFLNKKYLATVAVLSDGRWSLNLTDLPAGKYNIKAISVDFASNTSNLSKVTSFVVNPETGISPAITEPINNFVTTEKTILLKGVAAPNSSLRLLVNNKELSTVTADSAGKWELKLVDLTPGIYNIKLFTKSETKEKELSSPVFTFRVKSQEIEKIGEIEGGGLPVSTETSIQNNKNYNNNYMSIFLDGNYQTDIQNNKNGQWIYQLPKNNLSVLNNKSHTIKYIFYDKNKETYLIGEKTVLSP